ncbi:hypothetical protein HETIRDRAFT_450757 [Heterobasidion irregulare TC 32-1]|uniref:Secreted protein n=1 Tax=Heterobasidion irregulare (strain TC 32-1) TaxID=747525 RepID=W4KDA2_HETIT|nr:uncharacterized protein HETIRDRAFT_450757 [Heterobasidion irregulare TC 32-1]ETW83071.1 hypothetical protein HETIRDRAFT_450757 [Heterobasidion irregulare TC 32-1]
MKSFAIVASLVAIVPAVLGLTVDTPASVVQCQPIQFTWHDGTPPYYLSLIPANQPSAAAIKSFPTQTGTTYTWKADLEANTNFNIALKDTTGNQVYSALVTIQSSSDNTCLNTTVDEGSASSSSGSSAAASGSAAASSGSATTASAKASGSSSSSAASASSSTAANSSNGASRSTVTGLGIAGLMGLVGAALF